MHLSALSVCVHGVAQVDDLRDDPERALASWFAALCENRPRRHPPSVKLLRWAFVTNPRRDLLRKAVAAMLGGRH